MSICRKYAKTALKTLVSFSLLGWFLWHADLASVTRGINSLSMSTAVAVVFIAFLAWFIAAYKWWWILAPAYQYRKVVSAFFVGQYYATVLPGQVAGDVFRAYRLGKGRTQPEKVVASVIVDRAVGYLAILLIAIAGAAGSDRAIPVWVAASMIVGVLGIGAIVWCVTCPAIASSVRRAIQRAFGRVAGRLEQRALEVVNMLQQSVQDSSRILVNLMLSAIFQLLTVSIIALTGKAIGLGVSFADWCWVFGLVSIAVFLPITVAGIGLREGAFVGALGILGVSRENALIVSFVMFGVAIIGASVGGVIEFSATKRRTKDTV